jgi:uncharacterized protein (DUF3820 family)
MTTLTPQVIPFGKYKGHPVEVMLADKPYVDWLMVQDWFINGRYQNVYNTIINYGVADSSTPEHNKMQARFLDDDLCFKVISLFSYALPSEELSDCYEARFKLNKHAFEICGWDVLIDVSVTHVGADGKTHGRLSKKMRPFLRVGVELKPSVGDDYPNIIRQVRNRSLMGNGLGLDARAVIYDDFTSSGVTEKQVEEMFPCCFLSFSQLLVEGAPVKGGIAKLHQL